MFDKKTIAVVGATGLQGDGLVRAILDDPDGQFAVRALTRDPGSEKAQTLAKLGAEVVAVDIDDEASVTRAFEGAYGAYCNTFFWYYLPTENLPTEKDFVSAADKEIAQAAIFARAAKAARVEHTIWSGNSDVRKQYPMDDDRMPSVGRFKVPHMDAKAEASRFFRDLGVPTTVLRPAMYMDNFISGLAPQRNESGVLSVNVPLAGGKMPLIASEDIGKSALAIFKKGAELVGQTVNMMGDHLTGDELVRVMGRELGETVVYEPMTLQQAAELWPQEVANQFQHFEEQTEWWANVYSIKETRGLNPALQSFSTWFATNKGRIPRP